MTNYIIKSGNSERRVPHKEFTELFRKLRDKERKLNKTLFYYYVDYNDEYIYIK